jgi:hypothetical protein
MAGWIHSQIVSERVLQSLLLVRNENPDVQLSIAKILSSLCVAPHTRIAVIDAKGVAFLIKLLFRHNESTRTSRDAALFAGRALLQLATGEVMRASAIGDRKYFGSLDESDGVIR